VHRAGEKDTKLIANYCQAARKRMIHKVCAQVWQLGVPWAQALEVATAAISAADPAPRPVAKGKGGGKANAKGTRKGRAKGH